MLDNKCSVAANINRRRRVSSVWPPLGLPGLTLSLDANAITGLSDGDKLGTWEDQSGNGNDVTQAAADNKPVYNTNILNGHPAVRFKYGPPWANMTGTIGAGLDNYTLMAVVLSGEAGGKDCFFSFDSADPGHFQKNYFATYGYPTIYEDGAYSYYNDLRINDETWAITTHWREGSVYHCRRNGVTSGTTFDLTVATTSTDIVVGDFAAGVHETLNGYIAGLVLCSGVLSSTNILAVESY